MYWANFLHIYQPPTQKPYWINKIARESYSQIFQGLKKNRRARVTLNINAILTELLIKHGWQSIIDDIRLLAQRGQIEFTASAKYHPFLPLLPKAEISRQIELNHLTNKKIFGKIYNPVGFFPTEMGFNAKVAEIASHFGFEWIILAELAFPGKDKPAGNIIYHHQHYQKLKVFFRNRDVSFRLLSAEVGVSVESSQMLTRLFGDSLKKQDTYLITAIDGETFGHHRPGLELTLFDLYKNPHLQSITIKEINKYFSTTAPVIPRDSTWALLKSDLIKNTPFSRWYNKNNAIQQKQWQLTRLALKLIKKYPQSQARRQLDSALHSDQYWWSSAQPWWSVEMIEAGAKDLLNTVNSFKNIPVANKKKAEQLYRDIIFTSFNWQRTDKIARLAKEADEDVTQRITKELPFIPPQEFIGIINNLNKQMLHAASGQEYERAAQLRDRVKELKEKEKILTTKH